MGIRNTEYEVVLSMTKLTELLTNRHFDLKYYLPEQRRVDFSITTKCSLRCPYCIGGMLNDDIEPSIWDRMGTDILIEKIHRLFDGKGIVNFGLPGRGEPTEHPDFVRMACALLSFGGCLKVQTNLLFGYKFVEIVQKMGFSKTEAARRIELAPSYHYGTFLTMGDQGQAIREKLLHKTLPAMLAVGIHITGFIIPMTPELLWDNQFVVDMEYLASLGATESTLIELHGQYHGKTYPDAYTKEECDQLLKLQARFHYNPASHGTCLRDTTSNITKLNPDKIKYYNAPLYLRGLECSLGCLYVGVNYNGDMSHCGAAPKRFFGNLFTFDPTQDIFDVKPVPCTYHECGCRAAGNANAIIPNGFTLDDYYCAYYWDQRKPEIARMFKEN